MVQQHDIAGRSRIIIPDSGIRPYYLFERASETEPKTGLFEQEEEVLDHGKAVRCAWCKAIITYQGNAVPIQGQHIHRFANPQGHEFTIGCFRRAWCKVMGQPTLEWSWFYAHTWQYALCPQCQEHLGWYYHSAADDSCFYGLILDRLINDPE